jgi:Pyruvate/2-oxoacid:ferredoxin oxidoreductase delta subunit
MHLGGAMTEFCNDIKADDLEKSNESAINFDRCKECEFNVFDIDRTACIECEKDYLINRSEG